MGLGGSMVMGRSKGFVFARDKGYNEKDADYLTECSSPFSQLHQLVHISVHGCAVSHAGQKEEISGMCPSILLEDIRHIDLSKNLVSYWDTVIDIASQVPNLETLDIRFFFVLQDGQYLKNYTLLQIILQFWKGEPDNVLHTLKLLDLSNNQLLDGSQLHLIGHLPSFHYCLDLFFFLGCKTQMFPSLKHLAINDNKISQWSSINELEKLPSLQVLECRSNPLMDTEKNPETLRQLIIAKISQLEVLNKSEIFPDERRGAELDYRKIFGKEWLAAGGHWDPARNKPSEEFLAAHPRYPSLCLSKYESNSVAAFLWAAVEFQSQKCWSLTIKCPDNPEQKPVEKKLPESMTIQRVKGLLYRLLRIPGSELKLSYESSKLKGKEVELDNDLKPLQFYSIENGDSVLVRW
ncbi:hypothetical protein CIB84_006332 [Bambusicola thoracicus]|uniref:Ubiquitin-like domain-containing protein n=1 Tax=Bambusicola thoracicus TaxID=9083 RepID=A0A2P4T0N6_BAMTH|nr:hypothetical protein CIB84_006332 [Bambusicola thoracicus]